MRIVYVYADSPAEWNCSEWRCAIPARAINRAGRHQAELVSLADFGTHTPAATAACERADVIVVQRNLAGPVLSAIQHWKARGKVLLADFDDAYDLMPPSNPAYAYWIRGLVHGPGKDAPVVKVNPPPLTQFKWGLRLVDAATVPSKRLASDWQAYTDVRYLPNYIELSNYQNIKPAPHQDILVGWGGSLSHLQSFTESHVMKALQRVCRARPQVKALVCGSDRRIFDDLPLPAGQKILQPWVPYSEWPQVLSRFDIGIAPLYGPYDERRSWIKVLEYMVMKIPWAASDGPAYSDLRPFGWLVSNTAGAWERLLLDMVDHLDEYRQNTVQDAYLYALAQSVDENVEKIVETYASIAT